MRVELMESRSGRLGLRATQSVGAMNHLTLQVRELNSISINDANTANPSCSQIKKKR
jgi:hypothetical protein